VWGMRLWRLCCSSTGRVIAVFFVLVWEAGVVQERDDGFTGGGEAVAG
jgi:hypothetical protein